ncbi:MAG: hypothetical protein FWH54_07005 [Methanobrevibacter sp.]|nr:hypothetical protein [Methanobrevibacter sp.]
MPIYVKKGDGIRGDKIIAESRKISNVQIIAKSGRHKAQRIVLKDNATCVIDKETKISKK